MTKIIITLLALIALSSPFLLNNLISTQILQEKCCTACTLPAVKYVSIRNDKCGESCIDPKNYNKIRIFEPTLVLANSNTPCADAQYSIYNNTVTHGYGTLSATLDMYLWGSR